MHEKEIHTIDEDEIDLKELAATLWKGRRLILSVTFALTLLAAIYAFTKSPVFEAKAIIELGKYKQGDKEHLIDTASRLSKELEVLFISIYESHGQRTARVEKVSTLKGQENFIETTAQGDSNDLATAELVRLITHVQEKHHKRMDEIIEKKRNELQDVERKISVLKENTLPTLEEKIKFIKTNTLTSLSKKTAVHERALDQYKKQLSAIEKSLQHTKQKDPSLTALDLMEKRSIEKNIADTQLQIIDLNSKKDELLNSTLPKLERDKEALIKDDLAKLEESKNLITLELQPHNYQNTAVVGQIITKDSSVKPKKALIIAVAFITGAILGIFLVFFREFVRGFKKEDFELKD